MMPGDIGRKVFQIPLGIIRYNVLEVVWNIAGYASK